MALPINIEDLINQRKVERTRIEYKSDWNPEPVIHSITAFVNDFDNMGRGYILIGVEEENGRPRNISASFFLPYYNSLLFVE